MQWGPQVGWPLLHASITSAFVGVSCRVFYCSTSRMSSNPTRRLALPAGAGAGSLPSALQQHLPAASIVAVDLDPHIISLGRTHFGLTEGERLQLQCGDGAQFLKDAAAHGRCFDVLIIDIADTSLSSGSPPEEAAQACLTAPPPAFLSRSTLAAANQCLRCATLQAFK